MGRGPDPNDPHPMPGHPRVCFLKPITDRPNIEVGDYTHYDDPDEPERFAERNVLYHFDFIGDRLVIGRFCAIGTGALFVMNGANHALDGLTTYPFQIFGGGWEEGFAPEDLRAGFRGDTVVGNDVWIGREAMILPGTRIGDGAVIGARTVVTDDVPPYSFDRGRQSRPGRAAAVQPRQDRQAVGHPLVGLAGREDYPACRIAAGR